MFEFAPQNIPGITLEKSFDEYRPPLILNLTLELSKWIH